MYFCYVFHMHLPLIFIGTNDRNVSIVKGYNGPHSLSLGGYRIQNVFDLINLLV